MAIHIKVSRVKDAAKKGINFVDEHPSALSGTAIVLGTANLVAGNNRSRKERKEISKQVETLEKLNDSIETLNKDKKKRGPILGFSLKK